MRINRLATAALGLALAAGLTPATSQAQSLVVGCAPGIPGCEQVRYAFSSGTAISFSNLMLSIVGGASKFRPGPAGPTTSYGGEDAVGPLGGFATLSGGGSFAYMDFINDLGFTFDLSAGGSASFVQLEQTLSGGKLDCDYIDFSANQGQYSGRANCDPLAPSTVPEPATIVLLGSGLVGIAIVARRRRNAAA